MSNAIVALGGTADTESVQHILQEEEAKEKAFLEHLAQKLKEGGVSITKFIEKEYPETTKNKPSLALANC